VGFFFETTNWLIPLDGGHPLISTLTILSNLVVEFQIVSATNAIWKKI